MTGKIYCGDSAHMTELADDSIDALVTDPPAGIAFMGKAWDSYVGDRRQPGDETFTLSDSAHRRMKVGYERELEYVAIAEARLSQRSLFNESA